jgi:hypothetical protein
VRHIEVDDEEQRMTIDRKQREQQQPTVADAGAVLRELEAKRAKHIERGRELPELRAGASYLAHVEGSPGARRTLKQVNAEAAMHASDLASIDDAIAAAKNKLAIAQAHEAQAADRTRADEALKLLVEFRECGHILDGAVLALGTKGHELMSLVQQLHGLGIRFPSAEQVDVFGDQAIRTCIASTPWSRRHRVVAPSERKSFRKLVDDWAMMIETRIKAQFAEKNKDEAA